MTRAAYYVTRIQAEVIHRREDLLAAYELSPDTSRYWAFIDLARSSNFRLVKGAKEGYVRGEQFYTLVYAALAPYGEIERLKELGDGVLIAAIELRPLFEASALITQTASELGHIAGSETYPFAVRTSIGYGPCKALHDRLAADYLGSPIDIVARLNGAAEPNEILIGEEAYRSNRQVLEDYEDFVEISNMLQLSANASKNMVENINYRRATVDHTALAAHEGDFAPWKKLTDLGIDAE
jgi:class 3 adenylate cyclase